MMDWFSTACCFNEITHCRTAYAYRAPRSFQLPTFNRGGSSQFPGVLVGPPPVRKCHQLPSKEHIQLGWVVRWVPNTPPRVTPRLGGVYVSCQYFPCSFALALRDLGLRLGVKAPLPLRASSRGVLPGAPNALSVSSVFHPRDG
jgi:hypothetical protein